MVFSTSTLMGEAGPREVVVEPSTCLLVGFPDLHLETTGTASLKGEETE